MTEEGFISTRDKDLTVDRGTTGNKGYINDEARDMYVNKDKETTTGNDIDPEGINHPKHYNAHPSGVECIEVVRHMNFNLGNVVKYLWRAGLKDAEVPLKDLKKAAWYLQDEISRREKDE